MSTATRSASRDLSYEEVCMRTGLSLRWNVGRDGTGTAVHLFNFCSLLVHSVCSMVPGGVEKLTDDMTHLQLVIALDRCPTRSKVCR